MPSLETVPPIVNLLDDAAYREFWLELFRIHHPELKGKALPSRLQSFFASETIEDARRYVARNGSISSPRIFEIECASPGLRLDMTWLDHQFPRDFRQFGYYYARYWKGERIDDDEILKQRENHASLTEILLAGEICVGDIVE